MNSLKGHFLVASPELLTPFFTQTVILMLEHGEGGAMGLVVNRQTEATVADIAGQVFEEPFDWDKPIGLGGPVPGPLTAVHAAADLADREVVPGVYTCIEASHVREVIRRKADPCLILANYAGWGPGQLESEFGEDSWLTLPATAELIFWDGPKDLWEVVVKAVNARKLSEFLGLHDLPPDPSVN